MKDTMAMERLQRSDYILKIYGNCGSSQILEAASHGALYDQMVLAKNTDDAPDGLLNDPQTNLRVSYHLAKAVADVHGIDGPNAISFTHNDIACDQYIFIDGVFKLNDFHYASNELRSRISGVGCKRYGVPWSIKVSSGQAARSLRIIPLSNAYAKFDSSGKRHRSIPSYVLLKKSCLIVKKWFTATKLMFGC